MEHASDKQGIPAKKQPGGRRILIVLLTLLLAAALILYLAGYPGKWIAAASPTPAPSPAPTRPVPAMDAEFSGLAVWFLDVGQGDCAFLRSPEGKTMLIDAGPEGSFGKIKRFLDQQGVMRLDSVVCTHFHTDHFGSLSEVLDHYEVGALYVSPFDIESSAYAGLLSAMERNDVVATPLYASATSTILWDELTEVRVLSPFDAQYEDENDTSLMLRVQYGATAVLFAGDAGLLAEKLATKALPNRYFHANVLKVGHHGSASATGNKFLETVKPSFAVISVGADNGYGLPDESVLNRFAQHGVQVFRTDMDKTVLFALDGTNAWVVE